MWRGLKPLGAILVPWLTLLCPCASDCSKQDFWDYPSGTNIAIFDGIREYKDCFHLCNRYSGCNVWTWNFLGAQTDRCFLKSEKGGLLGLGIANLFAESGERGTCTWCFQEQYNCNADNHCTAWSYSGSGLKDIQNVQTYQACALLCLAYQNCESWNWNSGSQLCELKDALLPGRAESADTGLFGGVKCSLDRGYCHREIGVAYGGTVLSTSTETTEQACSTACFNNANCWGWKYATAGASAQTCDLLDRQQAVATVDANWVSGLPCSDLSVLDTTTSTATTTTATTTTITVTTSTVTTSTATTSTSTTWTITATTSTSTTFTTTTSSNTITSTVTTTVSTTSTTSTRTSTITSTSTLTATSLTTSTSTSTTTMSTTTSTTSTSFTTTATTSVTSSSTTSHTSTTLPPTTTTFAPAAKCVVPVDGIDCSKLLEQQNLTRELIAAVEEGLVAAYNAKTNGSRISRDHCSSIVVCKSQSRRLTAGAGLDVETVVSAQEAAIPVEEVVSTLEDAAQAGAVTSAVQGQLDQVSGLSAVTLPGATITVSQDVSAGLFLGPPPLFSTEREMHPVQVILAPAERALLQQLRDTPTLLSTGTSEPSGESAAGRLSPSADPTLVSIPGTEAAALVPAEVYSGVSDAAMILSLVDSSLFPSLAGPLFNGRSVEVAAAMNVDVWSLDTGELISVQDLQTPIQLFIPVNDSEEYVCGYWDVTRKIWQTDGLVSTYPSSTVLGCATGHLSFFAAIWKGFLATILCANIDMLTWEALQEIWSSEDKWYVQRYSLAYFGLCTFMALLMVAALVLDRHRVAGGVWNDECFLIPTTPRGEEEDAENTEDEEHVDGPTIGLKAGNASLLTSCSLMAFCSCLAASCTSMVEYLESSSAIRDALDEIFSSWFDYFSEVRDLLENLWEAVSNFHEYREVGGVMLGLCHAATATLVTKSVRRLTGARLNISDELVEFIMEDEDVGELLLQGAVLDSRKRDGGDEKLARTITCQRHETRLMAWHNLHASILTAVDADWHIFGRWSAFPCASSRIFRFLVPPLNALLGNPFIPASMRVMLLVVDMSGSWMLAAFFYQASGGARGKRQRGDCDSSGFAMYIGRLIAILLSSMFLAEIPQMLICSMHVRSFRKVPEEFGPEWMRQLKVWRVQDRLFWLMSTLYTCFCHLFILTFLANCHPDDISGFGLSGVLSVTIDFAIFPLLLATAVPIMAMCALSLTSVWEGEKKSTLLEKRRKQLADRGNWSPIVVSI